MKKEGKFNKQELNDAYELGLHAGVAHGQRIGSIATAIIVVLSTLLGKFLI